MEGGRVQRIHQLYERVTQRPPIGRNREQAQRVLPAALVEPADKEPWPRKEKEVKAGAGHKKVVRNTLGKEAFIPSSQFLHVGCFKNGVHLMGNLPLRRARPLAAHWLRGHAA